MEIRKNFEKIMKLLCGAYEIFFYMMLWAISNHYLIKIGEVNYVLFWGGVIYMIYYVYKTIFKKTLLRLKER